MKILNLNPGKNDDDNVLDRKPITKPKEKTKKPDMYKVLIFNDDYTHMDLVVDILQTVFGLDRGKAFQIMLHVHQRGVGVVGVYTKEIAEKKKDEAEQLAKEQEAPLKLGIEKD